ncbi:MAG TPA: DEAD/DEAH box helicase, partial [Polyangiaceae bacterium]|nr:DEAD/DEAH box helicase [Polyangiaceae bacterium]
AADGDKLAVTRVVVGADGAEETLHVSLAGLVSGREKGPAVEPDKVDLTIDRLLSMHRVKSLHADVVAALVPLLADAEDVTFEGAKVIVDEAPLGPRAVVTGGGRRFVVRLEVPSGLSRVVAAGVGLVERDGQAVLRPFDLVELTGPMLERLPTETVYSRDQVAELIGDVLPRLRERGEVEVRAGGLPEKVERLTPRLLLDVEQRGGALSVMPLVVYGDPPCARVDGDDLVHLGGPVPKRDKRAEQWAVATLREELDMTPGRRVEAMGREAIALARRLRGMSNATIEGDAHERLYPAEALEAEVAVDGGDVSARFSAGGVEADPGEVLRAWQRGEDVVALAGGGWAELPLDWLSRFGHRVMDLLAARRADGSLAPHAKPALVQLCDALERPRPPELSGLVPLVDGFSSLPEASLPDDLAVELRPYQRTGVAWLQFLKSARLGGVLADDMGLGKTLQALCVASGRVLVVCPRSVVFNWVAELSRFRPTLRHAIYHGPNRSLDENADVVLTTYALLRNDIDQLEAVRWDAVVLDEAQTIKNPDSQVARAAFRLQADFRLTLSGTPVENRLEELWSQMHFVNPGLLGGRDDFEERYERPLLEGVEGAAARLRERIKPFVLRRTKNEVLTDLPPRTDDVLLCELRDDEREIYEAIQAATRDQVVKRLGEGGNVMEALEALLRLRQAACDATLVPGQRLAADPDEDGEGLPASSKVRRLMLALEDAAADGHKALVFSQWTSLLDRVEPHLQRAGIDFVRLDGSTRDREGVVERFQDPAGPPVMIISLKAGGTGLNLTAADHVFMLDPWWNPAVEDQAADRAHRIGQTRPVMVYRLVAKDTVEERILALQEKKRAVADAALGGADAAVQLTRADLVALLDG